jgi:hypothetical protein
VYVCMCTRKCRERERDKSGPGNDTACYIPRSLLLSCPLQQKRRKTPIITPHSGLGNPCNKRESQESRKAHS